LKPAWLLWHSLRAKEVQFSAIGSLHLRSSLSAIQALGFES
jgi:hypothetical protein